jgi:hypothetical protein
MQALPFIEQYEIISKKYEKDIFQTATNLGFDTSNCETIEDLNQMLQKDLYYIESQKQIQILGISKNEYLKNLKEKDFAKKTFNENDPFVRWVKNFNKK